MKRHDRTWLALGGVFLAAAIGSEGCSFNPFAYEPRNVPAGENGGAGGSGTTSGNGPGASGASGGFGGEAGSGGASTDGGTVCSCPLDGEECTIDECNAENVCVHSPVSRGTLCVGGVCDDNGSCAKCLNCSAPSCTLRCRGTACENGNQCVPGDVCDAEENLCCDDVCTGPCKVCDLLGNEGTCTNLPVGMQVDQCDGLSACSSNGTCIPLNGTSPLGGLCGGLGQGCLTGTFCKAKSCRTANGGRCTDHLECVSNSCDPATHNCKSCNVDSDCPDGSKCNTSSHICKSWLSTPCFDTTDCAIGFCSSNLCALPLGAGCTNPAQCASLNCKQGQCVTCANNNDCAAGTTCMPNSNPAYAFCLLSKGNLCVEDKLCNSKNCSGFPRRCQ
jgi:hypothetical protein